jgi:hypothetical protein
LWVGYEVKNTTLLKSLLPPRLEDVVAIKVFKTLPARYYLFFNFFAVESPYFKGHRLEIVTVARERKSGQKRFVILEYFSDTISSDPVHKFKPPNAAGMNLVETPKLLGAVIAGNYTVLGKKTHQARILSSAFSIGCNKYIYYGSDSSSTSNRLRFDPLETSRVHMLRDVIVHINLILQTLPAAFLHSLVRNKTTADLAFYYPRATGFDIIPEAEGSGSGHETELDYDNEDTPPLMFMDDFFFL